MFSCNHRKTLMRLGKGLGTAVRTLTIIPWPRRMEDDFPSSLMWFPVVGLVLGLTLYGIGITMAALPFSPWPSMIALSLLAAETWLTRGLHLDGLADWADSIGGGNRRERRLAIMKDPALGTFATLALFIVLLGKWMAFGRMVASGSIVWVVVILTLSRAMMAELLISLPYARAEEGMGRPFAVEGGRGARCWVYLPTVMLCLMFGPSGVVLFLAGILQTCLFRARIKRIFGGVTGDLLGTANEMIEITFLVLCALPGALMKTYTGWGWLFDG